MLDRQDKEEVEDCIMVVTQEPARGIEAVVKREETPIPNPHLRYHAQLQWKARKALRRRHAEATLDEVDLFWFNSEAEDNPDPVYAATVAEGSWRNPIVVDDD